MRSLVVWGCVVLPVSACTYGPEEQRAVIEQIVGVSQSYRGLVTVRYERFQRPQGLAAFPDGGKDRVHERVATLYLVDPSRHTHRALTRQAAPDSLWESFRARVTGLVADSVAYLRLTGCPRDGECYPRLEAVHTLRVTMSGDVHTVDDVPADASLPGVMLGRRDGEECYVRFSTSGDLIRVRFEEDGSLEPVFEVRDDGSLVSIGGQRAGDGGQRTGGGCPRG